MCFYVDDLEYSQKADDTWVLSISQSPGTFQVWSPPKRPIERLLPPEGEQCVVVTGWLKTSGVAPDHHPRPAGGVGGVPVG